MLKKILTTITVLSITMPALAGSIKIHDPWTTRLVPQTVATIDVQMDIGYLIHIEDQDPIIVVQDTTSNDPYHTYTGCKTTDIESNFPAILSMSVTGISVANGMWSGSINPDTIPAGVTNVQICVTGTNVAIEELIGGSKSIKVAEATIMVLPQ